MSSNLTQWTDQTPSRSGMPMDRSTYGTPGTHGVDGTSALAASRDRHVTSADRIVKGAFPGTMAWRPPNC